MSATSLDLPRGDDFAALCDGSVSTLCCGAFATFSSADGEPVLCCRACYAEVGFGREAPKPTATLRVGPIVRDDWLARDIAATIEHENESGEHEQQSNPFAAFVESSSAALTRVELEAVARDAKFYADPDGPGGSDESLRRAYGRLVRTALAAAATLPAHDPCSTCGAAITLSDTGRRVHADYSLAVRGRWGMVCSPADERCTFGGAS